MTNKCDICLMNFADSIRHKHYSQADTLINPNFWKNLIETKSGFLNKNMIPSYAEMYVNDRNGYTVCNACANTIFQRNEFSEMISREMTSIEISDKVDTQSLIKVFTLVWNYIEKDKSVATRNSTNNNVSPDGIPKYLTSITIDKGNKVNKNIPDSLVDQIEKQTWGEIVTKQKTEYEKLLRENKSRITELEKSLQSSNTQRANETEKKNQELNKKIIRLEKELAEANGILNKRKDGGILRLYTGYFALAAIGLLIILIIISVAKEPNRLGSESKTIADSSSVIDSAKLIKSRIPTSLGGSRQDNSTQGNNNYQPEESYSNDQNDSQPEEQPVTIPLLVGSNSLAATSRLSALGLGVTTIYVSNGEDNIGKVIKQNPTAGSKVTKGSTVILQVGE